MKTKRFLSIVLTLAMLLGMLPGMSLTASAADTTATITPGTDEAKTGTGTMTITLKIKAAQTITASDVTATYGDTDKAVSASVTEPTTGGGAITYAVKDGSGNYIDVAADGKLTIKKVPPTDGKAYVIVTAAATDDYAETTREVTVTISKAEATVTAKDQSIMVGSTVPDLSAPVLNTHYSVTGLVGADALTTAPTLTYQKNDSAATPDSATAGTYDIVPSGASAGDNYNISYTKGTLTITAKDAQTITASDVTATYGETDKSVSAITDGNGEISYAVKAGSEDYISVASDGKLTIKKVPADGKAYVTVTASETNTGGTGGNGYAAATKDVTVNISKATITITAKNQSIYVGGTVPTLSGADFYTVTGLVGEETLTTNPTLAYQNNGSAATPDNTTAGTYDIVPSGASAGDNYNISYTNGTLTITAKDAQTITASDVTATYGETDKSVSATTDGNGEISYAVKAGSEDYISVASDGKLTIKKVPADGKAYVTVTASETNTGGTGGNGYAAATKDVTVNISKATITITAKNQSIYVGGTIPTLSGADFYTVTGLVGEETLTTNPTLAYQKDGSAATPDSATAGTYDIVPSGASAGDNYTIAYSKGTLTISEKQPATVTKAPEAKTLTYNGSAQELVTAGTATGGTMQYALGDANGATQPYTTSIPTATDAGTYYVWYKVVGDENHTDSEPVCVTVLIAEKQVDPMPLNVEIHNYTNTGANGVPGDVPRTEFKVTIQIIDKESGAVVSTAADVAFEVMGGPNSAKVSLENVEFDEKVSDLSEAKYQVVVTGFPAKVTGVAPMSQEYALSYTAWPGGSKLITIYLKWDDGKRSEPERIKVYALPEDEIGAYTIREDGTKEYLIFHTYDICMRWLGSDELCRGYERCFHKENPYVNPFVKDGGLIGENLN